MWAVDTSWGIHDLRNSSVKRSISLSVTSHRLATTHGLVDEEKKSKRKKFNIVFFYLENTVGGCTACTLKSMLPCWACEILIDYVLLIFILYRAWACIEGCEGGAAFAITLRYLRGVAKAYITFYRSLQMSLKILLNTHTNQYLQLISIHLKADWNEWENWVIYPTIGSWYIIVKVNIWCKDRIKEEKTGHTDAGVVFFFPSYCPCIKYSV